MARPSLVKTCFKFPTEYAFAADALASGLLRNGVEGIRVLGPSPAAILRLRGEYRWQVTLRGQHLDRAREFAPTARGWSYDIDPVS